MRRKLPLLISALLSAAVAVFAWAAYAQLREALLTAGKLRAQSAAERLGTMLDQSTMQMLAEGRAVASDSALRAVLSNDGPAARSRLDALLAPRLKTPAVIGYRLLDRSGSPVYTAGSPPAHFVTAPELPREALDTASGGRIGLLAFIGGVLQYPVIAPVVAASGGRLGTLVQYRRVSSGQGAQIIGNLIGVGATLRIGNADGDLWTDFEKPVAALPFRPTPDHAVVGRDAEGTDQVGAAHFVAHTPWVVWITLPQATVIAPANDFLRRIAIVALIIVLLGTIGAWIASRRITAPLNDLTQAAEALAGGDYDRRVALPREDEIGRLASSFNTMAAKVGDAHHRLETRVAERTGELASALEKLREAQEDLIRRERLATLGQLAGGVGHELRNPLGVMTNALYLLTIMLADAPASTTEYLGILRSQIALAEKIVGDLLDFARIKSPQREQVSVQSLVDEQIGRVPPSDIAAVSVHLSSDVPPVYVDRVQVSQVLFNLLTNALQSLGDSPGSVAVRARRDGDGCVRIEVTDTGCGIPPESRDRVFEPLYTTKARGIGLGLSVSRALARANGGDITVESQVGIGSMFSIILPTSSEAACAAS